MAALPAWLVTSASAQTVVTGGLPSVDISAAALEAAGTLSFVQGDGTPGILQLTSSGTFTNSWSMTDAIGVFNLQGNSLTISSAVVHAGNVANGACAIGVQNGTLTLGQNSFLTGFTGTLQAISLGTIVIEQGDWLTNTSLIQLDSSAGTSTLTWAGAAPVTYSGTLDLSTGATPGEVVISTTQDTGTLALTGTVSGASDLRLQHATGVTATPTITLGLTGGFTGRTIIDTANVRIDTQASIGSLGLTLNGATLTAGAALDIAASQTLVINGASTIVGAGGLRDLGIDGQMQGSGNLTLDSMSVAIGGSTSAYTGAVTLRGGSGLTVFNSAWLASATGLSMNADGTATSLTWDSADDATFTGALDVGTGGVAFFLTTQDTGSLTLSGAVSGTSNVAFRHTGVTADPTFILALTGGFDGTTAIETAHARINTQESIGASGLALNLATLTAGTNLEIGATQTFEVANTSTIVGTGSGGSPTTFVVDGQMLGTGNLTIDALAMTVNGASTFTGGVSLEGGSSLTVSSATWLASAASISMNADGAATSFTYSGAAAGSYAGALNLGNGTATISSTENFSLTGTVSGTGNLLVTRSAGSTAEIGLGFTAGTFSGTTVVSSTAARLLTASSIGDAGLTLANGDLAIDAALGSLTIGATQDLTVTGISSTTGSGGASALTVDGEMAGNGTLAVEGLAMAVNGATSTFTGGITFRTGSSLTTGNAEWIDRVGAFRFDASATVSYTGNTDVVHDGLVRLSTDPSAPSNATFRSAGAGAGGLTLSGTVSGNGDLIVETSGGSTAAFTLALGGTFTGTTIVNDADVAINTQGSVGQAGLTLNGAAGTLDATIGAPLVFGNSQLLTLAGIVNMSGSTANAAINAQGGLHSPAAATLNLDDIDLTVGSGTVSTFAGDLSLTDGATLTLRGANLGLASIGSVAGGATVALRGIGTIGSIGTGADPFAGRIELGDLGVSPTSVLNVSGSATLAAASVLRSHLLSSSGGVGTADRLLLTGTFTTGNATANVIFD
ncbi:MAG: beta strand repeat-containing protein, partial [Phycisphaerales bacterium]